MSENQENAGTWPFDVTTLTASDGSITAKFVSFGATLTELWVKDRDGGSRDVVLGYDDNSKLLSDPDHPVFNAVVGRYANRIKNGRFSIPITSNPQPGDPNVYQITTNDGQNALHGGTYGWDRHNWTIVAATKTSVTYQHMDEADEGFPGTVVALATYSVEDGGIFNAHIHASASEKTPILLTQHIYWNLDAFKEALPDVLSHHLRLDAPLLVDVDGGNMPTGNFLDVKGTAYDFRSERAIGSEWDDTYDASSGGPGYNNCFVLDDRDTSTPRISLRSPNSGIRLDITTNQPAVQVYTAHWLNTPRKATHGGPSLSYTENTTIAIEQQGYIDAINFPEWGVDQIYYPGRDYEWNSTYKFSLV